MAAPDHLSAEAFPPAPAGTRIRMIGVLMFVVVAVCAAVAAWVVPHAPARAYWIGVCSPLVALPVVGLVAWSGYIRELRLDGDSLVIVRRAFSVRVPLDGATTAERDPKILVGARKIVGNDGLGVISGRFRSERYGKFRAYMSDPERAVVLRTREGVVAVSPDQPSIFIDAVHRRAQRLR